MTALRQLEDRFWRAEGTWADKGSGMTKEQQTGAHMAFLWCSTMGRATHAVDRHTLAQALPEHRYCDTQIRGHETCLAVADGILRRLAR